MTYTVHGSGDSKTMFPYKEDFMRFLIMILCLATLVLYGHAIAGLWGYFVGKPGMSAIFRGLLGGTATGALAVFLWHRYMVEGLFGGQSREPSNTDSDKT
jgi:hypothetical protein